MNTSKKAQKILEKISRVEKMERGKICRMTGRDHYNHQTWQDGKNVVNYVPTEQVQQLQKEIDNYSLFRKLMNQYADEIIRMTRKERNKNNWKKKNLTI